MPNPHGDDRRWLGLEVRLEPGDDAEEPAPLAVRRVTAVLVDEGATAVRETGRGLVSHLPEPEERGPLLARLRDRLEAAAGGAFTGLETWSEEDRDWAGLWRAELEPRRVGRRLIVAPPGSDVEEDADDLVVRLEPGMAFGSGDHGSTRGMLRLLEDRLRPGDRVLDAGTGSGILAIAAVRLGAERVIGVDADAEVLPVARENLERNGVADRVRLAQATVDTSFLALLAPVRYDLVAANLTARTLRPLLRPLVDRLARGGALLVGGILEEEAPGFRSAARAAGWEVAADDRDGGWWSACLEHG